MQTKNMEKLEKLCRNQNKINNDKNNNIIKNHRENQLQTIISSNKIFKNQINPQDSNVDKYSPQNQIHTISSDEIFKKTKT